MIRNRGPIICRYSLAPNQSENCEQNPILLQLPRKVTAVNFALFTQNTQETLSEIKHAIRRVPETSITQV